MYVERSCFWLLPSLLTDFSFHRMYVARWRRKLDFQTRRTIPSASGCMNAMTKSQVRSILSFRFARFRILISSVFSLVQRALSPEIPIVSVLEKWSDHPDARLIYKLKLFTDTITKSTDPKIVHMLFIEVRDTISLNALCHH